MERERDDQVESGWDIEAAVPGGEGMLPGAPGVSPEERDFFERLTANAAEILARLETPGPGAEPADPGAAAFGFEAAMPFGFGEASPFGFEAAAPFGFEEPVASLDQLPSFEPWPEVPEEPSVAQELAPVEPSPAIAPTDLEPALAELRAMLGGLQAGHEQLVARLVGIEERPAAPEDWAARLAQLEATLTVPRPEVAGEPAEPELVQAVRETIDLLEAQQVAHEELRRRYDGLEDALARLALNVEGLSALEPRPVMPFEAPGPGVEQLDMAIAELRHELGTHKGLHEELRARLDLLERAPRFERGTTERLEAGSDLLAEDVQDVRSLVQRVTERVLVMEAEASERERGLTETRGAYGQVNEKLADQEAWLEDLLENLEGLKGELGQEREAAEQRERQLSELESALGRLGSERVEHLETTLGELADTRLAPLEEAVAVVRVAHDELAAVFAEVRAQLGLLESPDDAEGREVAGLAERLLALEAGLAALAPVHEELAAKVEALGSLPRPDEDEVREQAADLERRVEGVEAVTEGLQDRLLGRMAESEKAHAGLAEQVKHLGSEALRRVTDLERRTEQTAANLGGNQAGLETLSQRVEARLAEGSERVAKLQQDLQALRTAAESRILDLYEERNKAISRLDRLEMLITDAMQSLTVSQSELQAARFELSSAVATLDKGQGAMQLRLTEHERHMELLGGKLTEATSDVSTLGGSVRRAQDQLALHGQRLAEVSEAMAMARSDQKASLGAMENRLEQFGNRLREGLESTRHHVQEMLGPRLELMEAQKDLLHTQQAQLDAQQQSLKGFHDRLEGFDDSQEALRQDVDAMAKAIADVTKQGNAFTQLLRAAQQTASTQLADEAKRLEDHARSLHTQSLERISRSEEQGRIEAELTRERLLALETRADEALLAMREQVDKIDALTTELEAKTSKAMVYQHMQIDWAVNEVNQLRKDKEMLTAEAQALKERAQRTETAMQEVLQKHQAEILAMKDEQLKLAARVSSLLRIVSQVVPKGT